MSRWPLGSIVAAIVVTLADRLLSAYAPAFYSAARQITTAAITWPWPGASLLALGIIIAAYKMLTLRKRP